MRVFRVKVNGKFYDAEVEEVKSGTLSVLTAGAIPAPVTANIKKAEVIRGKVIGGVSIIRAPLPGLIVEVATEIGKAVRQGEKLLVLEAMKMENAILAPVSGTVDKINVKVGESVNSNQEMIIIRA